MRSFIREKKIYCGDRYREVDLFLYTTAQQETAMRGSRSKKVKESEPKQKNLNDKNAKRYLVQLGTLNFGSDPGALHITATYDEEHLPPTIEAAEREISNYLRRVQYRRNKEKLPPLKFMVINSYSTGEDGDDPVRIHHHILMNGGIDRNSLEDMWRKRRKKGQIKGDKLGFINADILQGEKDGIAGLCNYLARQPGGKKRWSSSQNLKRPASRTNDNRYSQRQIENFAKTRPGREFWESKYPGWTLIDDHHGVKYEHNSQTGWAVYLKLRRIKPPPPRRGRPSEKSTSAAALRREGS